MYDLPSEDPEEPGLPDEFHALQPALLTATLHLTDYADDNLFTGTDINLYYDVYHTNWYERPDWFLSVGVPRLYDGRDLRLSYVTWQEGVNPFVAVELLSPDTEKEDLGETPSMPDRPPAKWDVYEKILRVPYYIVFNRYTDLLRVFYLRGSRYEELTLPDNRFWIPQLKTGLGLWQGSYQGIERLWLRWYGENSQWIELAEERAIASTKRAELAIQRAEAAESQLAALRERLRSQGIDPDTL